VLVSSPASAALPRALQELSDECETDACINKARRVFKRVGRKFEITQEFGSAQSRSTGSAVWEGDVVLTKYMEKEMPKGYWKGKRVLELGAGTGFASFVAALLGSSCVITDGDARVLELAKANAQANLTPDEQALLEYSQLKWENAYDPAWKYEKGDNWDVILAADVTYYPKNIPPLTKMIQRLAGPETEIFLAHTIRPTDGDSMESFKSAFEARKITDGPSFDGHKDTFIYRMRKGARSADVTGADPAPANDGCNPVRPHARDLKPGSLILTPETETLL
jgi:predicted nicotinamide N-methyase